MLTVKSLSCRRGRRLVFRDLGFTLKPGGLLLVSGRNGSGKSSLLRVLAGLLPAVDGKLLWQNRLVDDFTQHRARLHYLGHLDALKPEFTVHEMLGYWCALYRVAIRDIPASFALGRLQNVPVRYLSAGQKRRVALAKLILHKMPLWLLDEPITSLDEDGQILLRDLIKRHRAEGGLVVVASHNKSDFRNVEHLVLSGITA